MDGASMRKMRRNFLKGSAWVVGGLAAVLVLDHAWGLGPDGAPDDPDPAAGQVAVVDHPPYERMALAAYALDGDHSAVGLEEGAPADFVAECFSPSMVGEACYSSEGPVVGILSELSPGDLRALCSDALRAHGWMQVDGGEELCTSFVKGGGRYRWALLEISGGEGSGVATLVLREAA